MRKMPFGFVQLHSDSGVAWQLKIQQNEAKIEPTEHSDPQLTNMIEMDWANAKRTVGN